MLSNLNSPGFSNLTVGSSTHGLQTTSGETRSACRRGRSVVRSLNLSKFALQDLKWRAKNDHPAFPAELSSENPTEYQFYAENVTDNNKQLKQSIVLSCLSSIHMWESPGVAGIGCRRMNMVQSVSTHPLRLHTLTENS